MKKFHASKSTGMKTKKPVIAVFDIGKTNKKLLVFDQQYKVVLEESTRLEETADDDGFPCEDLGSLTAWMLAQYEKLKTDATLLVKAVNFSTYGASLVHLDEEGKRIGHLYNYLKPYPEGLMRELMATQSGAASFAVATSSPVMGHLNAGLQLYWIKKEKPELFHRIAATLHFPQYLSYLITGKKMAEMTNVGCHSALWDFRRMDYHSWLQEEGLRSRLSSVVTGDTVTAVKGGEEGRPIMAGSGLHDSSAAVIPYLTCFREPFIILSTGTWTISLNPFNKELPDAAELEKGCLSYLTYRGQPVKTTMLFAGNDHDQQVKRIAAHFNVHTDHFKSLSYQASLMERMAKFEKEMIGSDGRATLHSATTPSMFHTRNLSLFDTPELAYHRLIADIVGQQYLSTAMVLKNSSVQDIYVDGGFCNNKVYMQQLVNVFADKNVYAANMIQGTALGAALALHAQWNDHPIPDDLMALRRWKPERILEP